MRRRVDAWTHGRMGRLFAASAMLCVYASLRPVVVAAQQPVELIDRIAAIVGDRVILLSEVEEGVQNMRASGQVIPEDSAGLTAIRRQFLNELIDQEVMYQRARRDTTITITDQEINAAVEETWRQVRSQFRTDPEFRAALAQSPYGTPEEYRRFLVDQQRRSAMIQRLLQNLGQEGKLRGGSVGDADLQRAYQQMLTDPQRPRRNPTITLRQIVVAPVVRDSLRALALAQAESVRVEIERGADFATMARRWSDDGSRESGGDLGFFRRGDMVRPFEEVAFALRPGAVSPVVRTQYGYHLIMVERIQAAEIKARHILFSPDIHADDLASARRLADSLAVLVRAGASIDSLARIHGDTSETRTIGPVDRAALRRNLPAYDAVLGETPALGQVIGPFPAEPASPERTRFVVLQVSDIQPQRDYTFEEAREEMRSRLIRQQGIRNLVNDLRRQIYVDIRL
jgi:peptidyl-prolyl cis-trans isomerase SurA